MRGYCASRVRAFVLRVRDSVYVRAHERAGHESLVEVSVAELLLLLFRPLRNYYTH